MHLYVCVRVSVCVCVCVRACVYVRAVFRQVSGCQCSAQYVTKLTSSELSLLPLTKPISRFHWSKSFDIFVCNPTTSKLNLSHYF